MSIDKAIHSLITTLKKYFERIVYFGDKKSTLELIMLLWIIDEVYDGSEWYELTLEQTENIQKIREIIIRNNPELTLLSYVSNNYYKNVNTPQTIYTWQRVYDHIELLPWLELVDDYGNFITDEDGNHIAVDIINQEQIDETLLVNDSGEFITNEIGEFITTI